MKLYTALSMALLMMSLVFISACQNSRHAPTVIAPTVAGAPTRSYTPQERAANPGSLFAESDVDPLFSDSRARRIGDIVVVNIMESTSAQNTANTDADKESTSNYGVSSLFGLTQIALPAGMRVPVGAGTSALGGGAGSELSASGQTDRGNTVTSSIAARVIRVMPNGILQIEGVRQIRVNEETQYMVLSGTIRARDISADNTITSTQVADANIQYYGQGVLADKQKPGWFTRFMDNLWPF